MLRTNTTRAKLAAGHTVLGCDVRLHSPETIELLGAMGFDYVRINIEHEPYDEREVVNMIRAADSFGITPMIRLPNDPDVMRRFLEAGVQGVHIARINTAADAQSVVDAVRFGPQGKRTFSTSGRAGSYGVGASEQEVLEHSNREIMIILQVEEAEGLRNLDEILAVPYVDAVQIGPKDLWQSMGFVDTQEVWGFIVDALHRVTKAGRWTSMVSWIGNDVNKDKLAGYGELGVRMISVLQRELIIYGAQEFLNQARAATRDSAFPPSTTG
jgi:2-keto-3-deoxy-L-rhamnonate aldolase RhmA